LPKVFSDGGIMLIPTAPPLRKWGNYKELLVKSPFGKGGFKDLQVAGIYGKRYKPAQTNINKD
jgi:hypothetical protein